MSPISSTSNSDFFISLSSNHQQSPTMHRSFLGSVKDKLSRKSTSTSQHSTSSSHETSRSMNSNNKQSTTARTTSPSTNAGSSRNPFSNPSPATRRPAPAEAPPAYSEVPSVQTGPTYPGSVPPRNPSPAPSHFSAASLSTAEDPHAFLSSFDTIFVIDDSGSMAGRSWREVRDALRAITPICTRHDADGIDVYFLNHKTNTPGSASEGYAPGGYRDIKDAETVERLFASIRPGGGTPTGTRLQSILRPYLQHCSDNINNIESVKPINLIVITDGVPSDDVESVLYSAAKKLDKLEAPPYQVGVQFFQVGNEPGAREALMELDDELGQLAETEIRDMVDTVTWSNPNGAGNVLTADGILKVVLGAVVKRLDRRSITGEGRRRQNLAP